MPGDAYAVDAALAAERLRNARLINAFRLAGLLVTLTVELIFRAVIPGWIGASVALFVGWTLAAAIVFAAGMASDRVARAGSLAIAFVDMLMLYLLIGAIIDALVSTSTDGVTGQVDAARLSALTGLYYASFLVLASLALDRRQLVIATLVASGCAVALMLRSGSWNGPIAIMTTGAIAMLGTLLAYASSRIVALSQRVAEAQTQRERLRRYFSPQVASQLIDAPDLATSGETREVTILFCDLRDFTPLAEALPAPTVVAILNTFLERTVELVFAHGGTLDKYLGDGLMAYFGAPVAQADHASRAMRCALAMREALAGLNRERSARGEAALRMGIGVHTGSVVLGDIGTSSRRDYTIIGDAVNVAARLQELTKSEGLDILLSETTRAQLGDDLPLTPARPLAIRGRRAPLLASGVAAAADSRSAARSLAEP
jgi:adenylate cyclase